MFGHQFAKSYHLQDGICAEVIRHLRLYGNPMDLEINDMVYIISTIFTPASVLVCYNNNNNNNKAIQRVAYPIAHAST